MTKIRLDHSNCEHPKTKAGRAKCRKDLRESAVAATTTGPKPMAKKAAAKKGPVAKPVAPKKSPIKTVAPAEPVTEAEPETEPAE
ncbi:hypothetical protein ABZ567_04115 [Streptomyces sp. NPDC016459]|uniref:hypothetical protein n=1 Tax=Streptomyces sp. NPDC016459 TaxID=3157190 RepID=UPI00340778BE